MKTTNDFGEAVEQVKHDLKISGLGIPPMQSGDQVPVAAALVLIAAQLAEANRVLAVIADNLLEERI